MTRALADISRIARLEMAVRVLRTDINNKRLECAEALRWPEAGAYASDVDLVDTMMREHQIPAEPRL